MSRCSNSSRHNSLPVYENFIAAYRMVQAGQEILYARHRAVILSHTIYSRDLTCCIRPATTPSTTTDSKTTAIACSKSFWNAVPHTHIDEVR